MPGHPREMITMAERRFPVRIRLSAFVTASQCRGSGQDCIGRPEISEARVTRLLWFEILLHLRNALTSKFALLYQRLYNIGISYISDHIL